MSFINKVFSAIRDSLTKPFKTEGTSTTFGQGLGDNTEEFTESLENQGDELNQFLSTRGDEINRSFFIERIVEKRGLDESLEKLLNRDNISISQNQSSIKSKDETLLEIEKSLQSLSTLSYRTPLSEPVVFNTLQTPSVETKFIYNFFEPNEEIISRAEDDSADIRLASSRSQNKNTIPRCVDIRWDIVTPPKQRLPFSILRTEDSSLKRILYRNSGLNRGSADRKAIQRLATRRGIEFSSPSSVFEFVNNGKSFKNNIFITMDGSSGVNSSINVGDVELFGENLENRFLKIHATIPGLYDIFKYANQNDNSVTNETNQIASSLLNYKIRAEDPKSIKSDGSLVGLDYVGYIIEKERLTSNGNWKRVANYYILGNLNNNFIDTRVAYGKVYRYRVRSVIKSTIPIKKNKFIETFKLNAAALQQSGLTSAIIKQIENVTNQNVSYLLPQAAQETFSYDLTDQYSVLQDIESGTSSVEESATPNLQTVSAGSAAYSRNYGARLAAEQNGVEYKDRYTLTEIVELYNKIIESQTQGDIAYESYYFSSDPSKIWRYVSVVENKPPAPPSGMQVAPISPQKKIRVIWLPPAESQRDIKKISLYRRIPNSSDEEQKKWVKIDEENLRTADGAGLLQQSAKLEYNHYDDEDVDFGLQYVYALESEDVHGFTSFLSMQIGAELNPRYHIERREKSLKFVSGAGLRRDEIGKKAKVFQSVSDVYFARNKIKITPSLEFGETSKDFIIKITSLDTFEQKEVKITLNNKKAIAGGVAAW
jgi:hypothetical protein